LLEQQAEVERVLEEIGAAAVPQVLVYNKRDLIEDAGQPRQDVDWLEVHPGVRRPRVFVSARDGRGLPELRQLIADAAMGRLKSETAAALSDDPRFSALPFSTNDAVVPRSTLA